MQQHICSKCGDDEPRNVIWICDGCALAWAPNVEPEDWFWVQIRERNGRKDLNLCPACAGEGSRAGRCSVSPAVEKALERANELRRDAYAKNDPLLHAAADIAVHGIGVAVWLEDTKKKLAARGIVVVLEHARRARAAAPGGGIVRVEFEVSEEQACLLAALASEVTGTKAPTSAGCVRNVLDHLMHSAIDGVRRPGAWERQWLYQAFGSEWAEHLEQDPESPWRERPAP